MISFLYPDGRGFELIVCALGGGDSAGLSNRATTKAPRVTNKAH